MENNYTVIVRSVGERTEGKCIDRLKLFFATEDIKVVKNITPFTKAIRRTFEIALYEGKEWCLVVDADVLFYPEKLHLFLQNCNRIRNTNDNAFCFQAYLYDNFWEECRLAGIHLFRTKWIELAFPYIDNKKGRPESWILRNMSWQGYPCYVIEMSIGIHDFFQSYSDIVAKGMLHAQKHSSIEALVARWETNKHKNKDYEWILKGVELIDNIVTNDIKVDADYYRKIIAEQGIEFPRQHPLEDAEIEKMLKETYGIEYYHQLIVPQIKPLNKRQALTAYLKNMKNKLIKVN